MRLRNLRTITFVHVLLLYPFFLQITEIYIYVLLYDHYRTLVFSCVLLLLLLRSLLMLVLSNFPCVANYRRASYWQTFAHSYVQCLCFIVKQIVEVETKNENKEEHRWKQYGIEERGEGVRNVYILSDRIIIHSSIQPVNRKHERPKKQIKKKSLPRGESMRQWSE